MSLYLIITVIQALVAASLVGVVLMQRSEGGGLGIGGNPSGALGARGAADFLTRATRWLAITFVVLSILLAALAASSASTGSVTSTLDRDVSAPTPEDLLGETTGGASAPEADNAGDDPLAESDSTDPLTE